MLSIHSYPSNYFLNEKGMIVQSDLTPEQLKVHLIENMEKGYFLRIQMNQNSNSF